MNEREEAKQSAGESAKSTAALKAERAAKRGSAKSHKKQRTGPRKFIKEAIVELKKVDWPGRKEVVTYTTVVLISVVFMGGLIFAMDLGFAKLIFGIFK